MSSLINKLTTLVILPLSFSTFAATTADNAAAASNTTNPNTEKSQKEIQDMSILGRLYASWSGLHR